MTRLETLRYEMFVRIENFGTSHREQFPESSPAGQAFAAVAAAAVRFDTHASARRLAGEASKKTKANVRNAMRRRLQLIARAAQLVARATPDGTNRFALPARTPADAIFDAVRVFIRDGLPFLERFIPLGVPATVIEELRALLDRFEEADREWRSGKAARAAARDGISAALQDGLTAIRTLDVVIPNTATEDPALAAAWKRARRMVPKVKGPADKPVGPDGPADHPVVPPAEATGPASNDPLRKAS